MQLTYTFRNIDASDSIRNLIAEKLEKKVQVFLDKTAEIHVILELDGITQCVEFTLHQKDLKTVAKAQTDDMYKSIDDAVAKLRKQLQKFKERRKDHH